MRCTIQLGWKSHSKMQNVRQSNLVGLCFLLLKFIFPSLIKATAQIFCLLLPVYEVLFYSHIFARFLKQFSAN